MGPVGPVNEIVSSFGARIGLLPPFSYGAAGRDEEGGSVYPHYT